MWKYKSQNVSGNLHAAAIYISESHPDWDVVAMHSVGGDATVVVFRSPVGETAESLLMEWLKLSQDNPGRDVNYYKGKTGKEVHDELLVRTLRFFGRMP